MADSSTSPCCPVCGSIVRDPPRHRYNVVQAANHFCPPTRNRHRHQQLMQCIGRLWGGEESAVYFCSDCGFGFGHPFVGGDGEFYSLLHEQADYPKWRWDYDVAIQQTIDGRSGGRILDIGAGFGVFLRSLGEAWDRYAIESTPAMQEELQKRGLKVFADLESAVRAGTGTFQVVTLFQVLEHIASFQSTLACCRELLKDGGHIVITVPHAEAVEMQEQLTGCPDMTPNHIGKWSAQSLSRALTDAGFRPGAPLYAHASWRNFAYRVYLKTVAHVQNPRSLTAQIYRIQRRSIRAALLMAAGVFYSLPLLPRIRQMRMGSSMAMIGEAI